MRSNPQPAVALADLDKELAGATDAARRTPTFSGGKCDEDQSFVNRMFLWWVYPILRRGYHEELGPDKIPRCPPRFEAGKRLENILVVWEAELAQAKTAGRAPNLFKVLWNVNVWRNRTALGLNICQGLMMTVVRPLVVKSTVENIVAYSAIGALAQSVAAVVVVILVETMLLTLSQHLFQEHFGTEFIATLVMMVQHKSIRLAPGQGGNEVALTGNDIIRQFLFMMQVRIHKIRHHRFDH
jgi:hypothetical protein